ncbi:MAG: hypothetical protein JO007_06630 [Alphaproteobacteria bacterium]|nr:hypothetical protein [Alphaproteobacteria bacterium]
MFQWAFQEAFLVGGAPQLGINALSAALIALNAIHAQREILCDCNTARIHPIITKGGDVVSVLLAELHMEAFVRGGSREAIFLFDRGAGSVPIIIGQSEGRYGAER